VQRHYEDFRLRGAGALAVTPSRPEALKVFLAESAYPFPVVADPTRAAYRAFGLGRTSWWRLFSPGVLWRYLRLMWRGTKLRRAEEGEDLLQLGGDFVLDGDGRLVFAHPSREPTDRPGLDRLLGAVEQARG